MFVLHLLLAAIPAYFLGGINGAIISSKYVFRKDIRQYGSGNPGLTNFYRVFGAKGVLLVLAIDIVKTIIPVCFGSWLFGTYHGMQFFGAAFTALFVMLGHAFPVYYRFHGGKTVLAAGAALFFVDWRVGLIAIVIFAAVLALTRYVSLASIIAGLSYPVTVGFLNLGEWVFVAATVSAALLVFRHKDNIRRLLSHTESKFSFSKGGDRR